MKRSKAIQCYYPPQLKVIAHFSPKSDEDKRDFFWIDLVRGDESETVKAIYVSDVPGSETRQEVYDAVNEITAKLARITGGTPCFLVPYFLVQ